MDFTTLEFIFVFLPVFLAIYIVSKQSMRLVIILAASIIFILAGPNPKATLFWLSAISLITYTTGYFIERNRQKDLKSKIAAWVGILAVLSMFIAFKALAGGFGDRRISLIVCENSTNLFLCNDNSKNFIIPLGISFIAFQSISYIIDVLRNQTPHEKNFIKFASYALFFPKLISGPITRYKNINSQLSTLGPSTNDTAAGLRRILSGVIKRIVIANQVGIVADAVFNMPANGITPGYAWLGLLAYTIQIYFDFSGYTDIALGLAMTMGISLPENFNYPYTAQSISDFWRRWHITLSTWFREYVFFPLERRRLKFVGRQINILVVFLLTGLWHGFSLTFAAWGLIHGISIALESTSAGLWLNKVFRPFRHLYTLSIILLGWVFFRSPDLKFAMAFIGRLFGNSSGISPLPFSQTTPLPFIEPSFLLAMTAGIVFSMPLSSIFTPLKEKLTAKPSVFMAFQITGDILLILLFTFAIAAQLAGSFAPNIYANF